MFPSSSSSYVIKLHFIECPGLQCHGGFGLALASFAKCSGLVVGCLGACCGTAISPFVCGVEQQGGNLQLNKQQNGDPYEFFEVLHILPVAFCVRYASVFTFISHRIFIFGFIWRNSEFAGGLVATVAFDFSLLCFFPNDCNCCKDACGGRPQLWMRTLICFYKVTCVTPPALSAAGPKPGERRRVKVVGIRFWRNGSGKITANSIVPRVHSDLLPVPLLLNEWALFELWNASPHRSPASRI
ncbi:UNVERIFIED_CONTAM: hypothetical protein Sradi_5343300 [Sesamum radiatum]|uniref:Uncharacterized protein n=1 Tax=Sesamum radiatum TaxID=300843 RepID=A0AAW2LQ42_SESRA